MRTQIMLKTNVRNQRELVDYALRNGLIDPAKVR
jgi:DNA-binding CsgD family transcriptional regulator